VAELTLLTSAGMGLYISSAFRRTRNEHRISPHQSYTVCG
jgi:hypothetical protein